MKGFSLLVITDNGPIAFDLSRNRKLLICESVNRWVKFVNKSIPEIEKVLLLKLYWYNIS